MVDIYDYIKELSKIDVEFQVPSGKFYSLKSYVKRMDDDAILIESPSHQGMAFNLPVGQEVGIGIHTGSGIYVGQSKVLGKELSLISGVLISYPVNIQQVQRREYVRVPLNYETELTILEDKTGTKFRSEKVRLRDISGNGISFLSGNMITPYYDIRCKIFMNDGQPPLNVSLEHIYTRQNSIHQNTRYVHAFTFVNLERKNVERIVKACFKYQLEMRKKGIVDS